MFESPNTATSQPQSDIQVGICYPRATPSNSGWIEKDEWLTGCNVHLYDVVEQHHMPRCRVNLTNPTGFQHLRSRSPLRKLPYRTYQALSTKRGDIFEYEEISHQTFTHVKLRIQSHFLRIRCLFSSSTVVLIIHHTFCDDQPLDVRASQGHTLPYESDVKIRIFHLHPASQFM